MDRRHFIRNALATAASLGCGAAIGPLAARSKGDDALPLRPPGALDEDAFLSRCIRCLRCVDACPNNAIVSLDGAFGPQRRSTPAIKARRQACMLCNKVEGDFLKCTEACPSGALELIRKDIQDIRAKVAMGTAEIDHALCYSYNNWSCGACYHACPLPDQAITLGLWERPAVHPEACIGCGLCERACIRYPQAIRVTPGHAPRVEPMS